MAATGGHRWVDVPGRRRRAPRRGARLPAFRAIHWGLLDGWPAVVATFVGAAVIAHLSWRLIERPALDRKRRRRSASDGPAVAPAY
ncbi:MAG: hypothetical protein ACFCVK_21755 [Acidimicrobiales bacterium]